MRNFKYFIFVIVLSCTGVAAQVSPTMPAPNRNMTAPSRHLPPGGDHPESTAGTIEGFVYWDANSVSHVPANSCSGLAITVSVGSSSGPFTAYTPLGTLSNNFKYVGEVKEFLVGGKINVYDVCTYGYDKVPVGPDLQVTLTVAQSGAFLPGAVPQFANLGPIKIINAQCNMLPRIVNPTASDLATHWGSCQNMAYDVNFVMLKTPRQQLGLASPPPGSSGTQGGMLSGAPQQGMLSPGATPAGTQTPSNPGSQRKGIMPTDRPGSGGRVELNPQPFPPRQQLTNADVIRMVRAGTPESVIVHSIESSNKQFDFSPAGVQTLQQANVSPAILAAMCDGSTHSCPQGLGNTTPAALVGTSMKGEVNAGGQVSLNPQPLPPGQRLTNTDVIKMLRGGVLESVIIASIQSATRNFDFSPPGCRALQQANVTVNILKAMGDESVRPCAEITRSAPPATPGAEAELNPQPPPPGSKAASRAVLKPIKLASPKALRKITNPRLVQENASIIAVFERQRQAAQQESAAMKLGIRSVGSTVSARAPATLQGNATVQNLGPETTQSEHGNLASAIAHAPAFNSIVLTCMRDSTPRIIQLSGGEGHGIFTPEAKYNLYTITGCSFGQSQSGNSAYIYGMNGFQANLNIDFWSDNGIAAHLDPWLAGVLDQDNVTLVVAPAGTQPFNKSGYKFYAARGMPGPDGNDQDVTLAYNSMPNASVSLFNASPVLAGYDQVPPNGTSQFPSFSFQGTPVAGWVFRYAYGYREAYSGVVGADCFINDVGYQMTSASDYCWPYFSGSPTLGSDTWDFSKLVPGFVISTYSLYYEDTDPTQLCGSWDDYRKNSGLLLNWDFNLTAPTQISVTWPLYWCQDTELPPSGRMNEQKQSIYGLAVWVLGPRCVDGWTGQKDQSCMNIVKQMLS